MTAYRERKYILDILHFHPGITALQVNAAFGLRMMLRPPLDSTNTRLIELLQDELVSRSRNDRWWLSDEGRKYL